MNELLAKKDRIIERQSNMVSGQVNQWTSGQVNQWTSEPVACIKDKVTDEQSSFE